MPKPRKKPYRVAGVRPVHRKAEPQIVENVIKTTLAKAGLDDSYFKIFAIGFNKTATTSMSKIFEEVGLAAMDGPHWRRNDQWDVHYQFQAFSDGPPESFEFLDQEYPRSKFILNVRDLDQWLDSRIEHIRFRTAEGTHKNRGDWRLTPGAIQSWIKKRNEHHLKVLDYFRDRPEDLIVVNFIRDEDSSAKILSFIGVDAQIDRPYVRSTPNTREDQGLKNAELIAECLAATGVDPSEAKNDLYCPSIVTDPALLNLPEDTSGL